MKINFNIENVRTAKNKFLIKKKIQEKNKCIGMELNKL